MSSIISADQERFNSGVEPQPPIAYARNKSRLFLLAIALTVLAAGLLSAWHGGVFSVGDDGVSYLDLADAWRNHDWHTAANACWSPGYPLLLAVTLGITHPSPFWEAVVIRGLNLILYMGAACAFAFFWNETARSVNRRSGANRDGNRLPMQGWWLLGAALFLFFGVKFIGASLVSPDLTLFSCVLLIAGILVRIRDGISNWSLFAWLGAVCAIAYLFKAIMFPLTFVVLGVVFLASPRRKIVARLSLTVAVFVLISGPWIVMLSRAKGRLTYSDVGKVNYLWFASEGFNDYGYPFPWKPAPGEGSPIHPMRELLASPEVFEFRAPFQGSYPLWDDPAYWYEGAKIPFHWNKQVRTVLDAASGYFHLVEVQAALLTGALFLFLSAGDRRRVLLRAWYLALPSLIALALYAISHGLIQNRYSAPFLPVLWGAVFAELYLVHLNKGTRALTALSTAMALVLCFPVAVDLSYNLAQSARKVHSRTFFDHYDADVAEYLLRQGLHAGDSLGYLEAPEDGTNKYWARLAKMTIVADMSFRDVATFWVADAGTQAQAVAAFHNAGVKAVVAYKVPAGARTMGWRRVGSSNYYVLSLNQLVSSVN